MPRFILNRNYQPESGENEVHNVTTGCSHMPNKENWIDLGEHTSCHGAVADAKSKWPNNKINGCYYCCIACHTG